MPRFKSVSIKEALRIGEVDDEELATVLSSVLPRGAHLTTNDVEYRTADDEWVLSLRYKDGILVDAVTGPAFTSEIEQHIQDALAEAFNQPTRKVWRVPMFSLRRVEGWYRHDDDFLIRPAPAEAPRPDVEFARHPWVLEFTFADSPNFQLRNLRTRRRAYELALVLNLLLRGQISASTIRSRHHWILMPDNVGPAWLSEGYLIPGFEALANDFSDLSTWSPLAEQETEEYYGRRGFVLQSLTVSAEMTLLCDAFSKLSDQRARFLRSCYWMHTADVVWDYSQSLHLTSLIIAIECLAQGSEKRLVADASTKMFLDFMEEYASGRPSRTRLNKIYEIRSLVGHGERILSYDSPGAFGLHPTSTADSDVGREAVLLARGAIINWLVRQADRTTNLLTVDPYPRRPPTKPGTKSKVKIITP